MTVFEDLKWRGLIKDISMFFELSISNLGIPAHIKSFSLYL
mgnify:CR=1 FL=1